MFKIRNPFKREIDKNSIGSNIPLNIPKPEMSKEQATTSQPKEREESRATEIEIIIAKIDALKFQYEVLNEKINNIEKMVKEIYEMARSSS